MPLVRHSDLPTYDRLTSEGRQILPQGRALAQDIRELHIGLLNIMPDAALEATERQFFRLVGESNRVAQIYMHPFTLPVFPRGAEAQAHIGQYYETFEQIQADGLDALIITGASEESNEPVSDRDYWQPLIEAIEWAQENVTSTMCSCLASHAALGYFHDQFPEWRDDKRFGIFSHRVMDRNHPLLRGMNTVFNVPHARHSELNKNQFEESGFRILVESDVAGVHMATSPDGFRLICSQGHPEYDTFSLLKEYRREVNLFIEGGRSSYPTFPDGYFNPETERLVRQFQSDAEAGKDTGMFPEELISATLDNTWADSARSVMGTWIGLIYQITNVDRRKPFMDGIDPDNPLGN